MNTKKALLELRYLITEAEGLVSQIEREERAKVVVPAEPQGNKIAFTITFTEGGRMYRYLAHRPKIDKGWYLTGREGGMFSWPELVRFMQQDIYLDDGTVVYRPLVSGPAVRA